MNFRRSLQISLAGILLVLGSLAGCSHSRTDVQIANEVQGKIYADPNVPSRKIAVQSNNGVVTLSGIVDNQVVVPKDADVEGRVVEVKSAGHFTGRSDLGLELTKLIVNGRSYKLQTEEYVRQGSSRGKRTAETVGGGAAVGAIIGAVAGGGKGAAIGAATGAGAGTAVQAVTKGQQIRVPSEAVLEFQLITPLKVSPTVTNRNRRKLE